MLAIPDNVLARFNEVLKQRAIHETVHVYYRKWLRYFLDFCEKYPLPTSKSEQVRLFIEKLKSKKQTPQQCTQAAHTVSLYSRKTLKTYADWGRKFQRYLTDKPPEELTYRI